MTDGLDSSNIPKAAMKRILALLVLFLPAAPIVAGCSSSANTALLNVRAASPPKDDGKPAQGGSGGSEHSAALEELKLAALDGRTDKQNSVRVPLPDAEHWTRVKFWGVPSLVGFRYGKDHHAIIGAFVTYVDDNTQTGVCAKSFEKFANPWIAAFDVEIKRDPPLAFMWNRQIVESETVVAKTATIMARDTYAAAYAAYPAWKGACLILGVAVPSRDDEARAIQVRDRFAKEVLPRVEVLSGDEPKERY
jgi:hypothetical protein